MEARVLAVCPGSWTPDHLHGHAWMNMHARSESVIVLTNWASQTDKGKSAAAVLVFIIIIINIYYMNLHEVYNHSE